MIETIQPPVDAADIIRRIMAEMEEVFGLINRPLSREVRRDAAATQPASHEDVQQLAA